MLYEGLRLAPATATDIDALMHWFADAVSLRRWGGPAFRHPFTSASFRADLTHRGQRSFALRNEHAGLLGFGQFYPRWQRIHLSRIAVHPDHRGRGLGRILLQNLLAAGREELDLAEFGLFVYRDNAAAMTVYRESGFAVAASPDPDETIDGCSYMTRPTGR
jgi:ribosomal protein S18 acetylase RimI-like enzyme